MLRKLLGAIIVVVILLGVMAIPAGAARQRVIYAKLTWTPTTLKANLTPGSSQDLVATLEVDRPVSGYTVLVRPDRPGLVNLDTSNLPARLEPGTPYDIPVNITIPDSSKRYRLATTIVIRQGARQLVKALPLNITVTQARSTPTPRP